MRRAFLWINFVLASLIVPLVLLQAYLITAYVTGAGEGALDAHGIVGGPPAAGCTGYMACSRSS